MSRTFAEVCPSFFNFPTTEMSTSEHSTNAFVGIFTGVFLYVLGLLRFVNTTQLDYICSNVCHNWTALVRSILYAIVMCNLHVTAVVACNGYKIVVIKPTPAYPEYLCIYVHTHFVIT